MDYTIDTVIHPEIKICQPREGFRFGIDSVVLAWFTTVKKREKIIDIGSGSGIISILLNRFKGASDITAAELQPEMYDCLLKTIELNQIETSVKPICVNICQYKPVHKFHAAVCNPPYRSSASGKKSSNKNESLARFDDSMSFEKLLMFCKSYIYYGGRLAVTGSAYRLAYIINQCRKYNFEPKRVCFMHPSENKKAKVFFMECVYGAGTELSVEPPIIQKQQDTNTYSNILQGVWF
jgi:tRNA1Val (adenine37-N6)-methyltransferase